MDIEFTQYMLPNGRTKLITIDIDEETGKIARVLQENGVRFEIEILTTGVISMTAEMNDNDENLLAIELCPNGPGIEDVVTKLIATANKEYLRRNN